MRERQKARTNQRDYTPIVGGQWNYVLISGWLRWRRPTPANCISLCPSWFRNGRSKIVQKAGNKTSIKRKAEKGPAEEEEGRTKAGSIDKHLLIHSLGAGAANYQPIGRERVGVS